MDTSKVYSTKAEKYAKYRWDYAPQAIETIVRMAGVTNATTLADLGAGTGILTRHLVERAQRVYAIEPNPEMRQILARDMQAFSSVCVLSASAERTTLPDLSVDVITAAQAIHWFDPEPARQEMLRILKENGWLALIRNYPNNEEKWEAVGKLMTEEYGADFSVVTERPKEVPAGFYFGNDRFQMLTFPFQSRQGWDEFLGSLTTVSFMPDEDHPLFGKLEARARQLFSQYGRDGYWISAGETELIIGQPSP